MRYVTIKLLLSFAFALSMFQSQPSATAFDADDTQVATGGADNAAALGKASKPEDLLRTLGSTFAKLNSFQAEYTRCIARESNGRKSEVRSEGTIVMERPNRIAIRTIGSERGSDCVCDGKRLSISNGREYIQIVAPKLFNHVVANPHFISSVQCNWPLEALCCDFPAEKLMEGLTNVTIVGHEVIDGTKVLRVSLKCEGDSSQVWIATDGVTRVLQSESEIILKPGGSAIQIIAAVRTIYRYQYKNWRFNIKPTEEAFAFTPPSDAHRVDCLGSSGIAKQRPRGLIGKRAPDVELELLDGTHFSLKESRGKNIVVLYFWRFGATGFELPFVTRLIEQYSDRGVTLYSVTQEKKSEWIRKAIQDERLEMNVGLDSDGATCKAFDATEVPTLIIVDKEGIVQCVHNGADQGLTNRLEVELEALVAGKSLAGAHGAEPDSPDPELSNAGFAHLWTRPSRYGDIAVSSDGKVIVGLKGRVVELLDIRGNYIKSLDLPYYSRRLRCVRSGKPDSDNLIVFNPVSGLASLAANGEILWTLPAGISDAVAADLDHDNVDEVIVGAKRALNVFEGNGKLRWSASADDGIVAVASGDFNGDGIADVAATSMFGSVHIRDANGNYLQGIDPQGTAYMQAFFRVASETKFRSLVIEDTNERARALNENAEELWAADLDVKGTGCDFLSFAPNGDWVAVGYDHYLCILDLRSGRKSAVTHKVKRPFSVAWSTVDDQPLLLVASQNALTAWRVTPRSANE